MIDLGDKVKDPVTGFTGIAVARTTWLHGCNRLSIQPQELTKEGAPRESQVFDEMQLILVKKGIVKSTNREEVKAEPKTGGPRDDRSAMRRNV